MIREPIFAIIGLVLALATLVLFGLSIADFQTGVPGIFTMLLGGLFLLLGFSQQPSQSKRS